MRRSDWLVDLMWSMATPCVSTALPTERFKEPIEMLSDASSFSFKACNGGRPEVEERAGVLA